MILNENLGWKFGELEIFNFNGYCKNKINLFLLTSYGSSRTHFRYNYILLKNIL